MLELAGTPSDKYFQEWAATKRQRLQELLGAKGLHADELINQFLLHLPTSRKIILKSSNRFGYQIDHDGKYEKYFSVFSSCNRNFKINGKRPGSLWCGER